MKTFLYIKCFLILVLYTGIVHASDIPHTIAHQGVITSHDGTPINDGMYSFTVGIYDGESAVDPLWTETQSVGVINGIYNLLLGISEPLDLDFNVQYWIGISVNGGDELNPRIPLSSVPYAFHAHSVPDGSITSSKLADEAVTQQKIHPDVSLPVSGNAGGDLTGTYPDPSISEAAVTTAKIQNSAVTADKIANGAVTTGKLADNINITTTGTIEAVAFKGDGSQLTNIPDVGINLPYSKQTATSLIAFQITNTGLGHSIWGQGGNGTGIVGQSNSGTGIVGSSLATSGIVNGVHGWSQSTMGRGVYGHATASSGSGVGVYGLANSGTGVYGESPTIGIAGSATLTSGLNIGVQGASFSSSGAGVWAVAAALSGTNYGIFARTQSSGGYAGYFDGRVQVTGNLSKGGGSFKIDHPLNPENMILRHSFVESPDMMNVYNGNIITDRNGEATVQLPDYFEALNRDFRYQLTVIGEFAQAIVAEEITENRFVIRTDKPHVKVSWQVTGIRKDRWAEENRIVVEEYKTTELRGFYLHPEVFGQPKTHSIEWGRDPEGMSQMEESILRKNYEIFE